MPDYTIEKCLLEFMCLLLYLFCHAKRYDQAGAFISEDA